MGTAENPVCDLRPFAAAVGVPELPALTPGGFFLPPHSKAKTLSSTRRLANKPIKLTAGLRRLQLIVQGVSRTASDEAQIANQMMSQCVDCRASFDGESSACPYCGGRMLSVVHGEAKVSEGELVDVHAPAGRFATSLSRADIGNGACEVVFVQRVEVQRPE